MGAERCPIIWSVSCERKVGKRKPNYGLVLQIWVYRLLFFREGKVTKRKQNYGATSEQSLSHLTILRVILNGEHRASHVKDLFCEAKFTLDKTYGSFPIKRGYVTLNVWLSVGETCGLPRANAVRPYRVFPSSQSSALQIHPSWRFWVVGSFARCDERPRLRALEGGRFLKKATQKLLKIGFVWQSLINKWHGETALFFGDRAVLFSQHTWFISYFVI